jgi:hypothetical protein
MGLAQGALQLILLEHKRRPLAGRVVILGRQLVNASYYQTLHLFAAVGVTPAEHVPVPEPHDRTTPIQQELFFAMLGLTDVAVLDIASGWNPDIVADLNYPIPSEHHNAFGVVLNGGTLEHVFDVRTGFQNISNLAAPGGRIFHICPVNNYVNHGFVQFSPTAFMDYYEANGFVDLIGYLIVHSRDEMGLGTWNAFRYNPASMGGINSIFTANDNTVLAMFFSSTKTETSTVDVLPIQSFFRLSDAEQMAHRPAFSVAYDPSGPLITQLP